MIPARIDAVLLDVDGVLTDNRLAFGDGSPRKSFHTQDGQGLVMLLRVGVHVAWISGRNDAASRARADDLGIAFHYAPDGKRAAVVAVLAAAGVAPERAVFVGDDLPDLDAFAAVAWPVAVADAAPRVRAAARRVTRRAGGCGAVREVCDWVLARRAAP